MTGEGGWNSAATLAHATIGSAATIATAVSRHLVPHVRMDNDRRSLRGLQHRQVFAVVQAESDLVPSGNRQRRDTMQHQTARRGLGAVPVDCGRIDDRREGERPGAQKEAGIARRRRAVVTERC